MKADMALTVKSYQVNRVPRSNTVCAMVGAMKKDHGIW